MSTSTRAASTTTTTSNSISIIFIISFHFISSFQYFIISPFGFFFVLTLFGGIDDSRHSESAMLFFLPSLLSASGSGGLSSRSLPPLFAQTRVDSRSTTSYRPKGEPSANGSCIVASRPLSSQSDRREVDRCCCAFVQLVARLLSPPVSSLSAPTRHALVCVFCFVFVCESGCVHV